MVSVVWFVFFLFFLPGTVHTSSFPAKNATNIRVRAIQKRTPYQLSLNYPKIGHYCGGSIITKDAALTVVYCLKHKTVTNIFFRCGIEDLRESSYLGAFGKKSFLHEMYDGVNNIVALVLVSGLFPVDGVNVATIQIATSPPRAGSQVTVSGWTTYSEVEEENSRTLQSLRIAVVGYGTCAAKFGDYSTGIVAPGSLCAGPAADGKGYCFGDCGSPVVNSRDQLVGAVSWHERKCLKSDMPGIFCDFFHYRTWIRERLNKEARLHPGSTSSLHVWRSLPLVLASTTGLISLH